MRLREPTEKEIEIMNNYKFIKAENYYVVTNETDNKQITLVSKRGRRRTIKLEDN